MSTTQLESCAVDGAPNRLVVPVSGRPLRTLPCSTCPDGPSWNPSCARIDLKTDRVCECLAQASLLAIVVVWPSCESPGSAFGSCSGCEWVVRVGSEEGMVQWSAHWSLSGPSLVTLWQPARHCASGERTATCVRPAEVVWSAWLTTRHSRQCPHTAPSSRANSVLLLLSLFGDSFYSLVYLARRLSASAQIPAGNRLPTELAGSLRDATLHSTLSTPHSGRSTSASSAVFHFRPCQFPLGILVVVLHCASLGRP